MPPARGKGMHHSSCFLLGLSLLQYLKLAQTLEKSSQLPSFLHSPCPCVGALDRMTHLRGCILYIMRNPAYL